MKTERWVEIGVIVVLAISMLGLAAVRFGQATTLDLALMVVLPIGSAALLFAGWRGWRWTRHALVLVTTLLAGLTLPEPFLSRETSYVALLGPALAVVLLGPGSTVVSGLLTIALLAGRASGGVYLQPAVLVIYGLVIGLLALAQVLRNKALRLTEEARREADASRHEAEQRAEELAEVAHLLEGEVDQQRQLLSLVATLETPAIVIADGVLLAPVVGHLDPRRSEGLTARLLRAVHERRVASVIIDVAGVTMLDTSSARAIGDTARALRLLGCEVTISGISAQMAATLTELGVQLTGVTTVRSPQEALARLQSEVLSPREAAVKAS
jgi:anti-anti-sigma regulatory factor